MRTRPTVRMLVIDPQQRILLFKIENDVPLDPARPDMTVYWGTPGGGVDAGETFEQAGLRELWEETGMRAAALGPWVRRRSQILHFPDEQVQFVERYYLMPVTTSQVALTNLHPGEQQVYRAHHWWTLAELRQPDVPILPPGLPDFLAALLQGDIPPEPVQLL